MIKDLDLTLKALLSGEAEPGSELAAAAVSFSVPDEEWRGQGKELALNVYLYDIRENRNLRSNQRDIRRDPGGTVSQRPPPSRIDCAFLVTAWNKVSVSGEEDKELQEHRLLSQVLHVLMRNPKIPADYLHGFLRNTEPDLPMVTAQKVGLPDPVEFWNGLGCAVRPSINCVITISLDGEEWTTGPMVISKITEYVRWGKPGPRKRVVQIGGRVIDTSNPLLGIDGAVVEIDELRKKTSTDHMGYYTFSAVPEGTFTFVGQATGYVVERNTFIIPAGEGQNYDIRLSKE